MNKVGLIFPGGGVQYIGMGKNWYDQYAIARETFEEASDAIDVDMKQLCFQGDIEKLSKMEYAQAAILLVSYTAYRVLEQELELEVAVGSGHSLGEYTALTCAGAIALEDAMKLIKKRGELLTKVGVKTNGTMMAVNKVRKGIIQQTISDLCLEDVYISVQNSPKQHVLSGPEPSLVGLGDALSYYGAESNVLNIDTTSHCPLMQEAAEELKTHLEKCDYSKLNWPVISNLDAKPYANIKNISHTLYRNMTEPVQWQQCMNRMAEFQPAAWIDVGPKTVYRDMLRFIFTGQHSHQFLALEDGDQPNLENVEKVISSHSQSLIKNCLQRVIATPLKNTTYNEEEFNQFLKAPYKKLQELEQQVGPEKELAQAAIDQFTTILQFKGIEEKTLQNELDLIQKTAN